MNQTKSTSVDNSGNDLVTRFRPYIMALSLVLISFAAHMISFWNGFVLNDHFNIPRFRDILKEDWPKYWSELVNQAVIQPYAEPFLRASLAIDFQSAVLAPALYHATNVLLHIAAVLSLFFLLMRLGKHFDRAMPATRDSGTAVLPFVACALFACHPVTSDTVAYISGRSAMLTVLFYTVALHCFLTGFLGQSVRAGLLGYLGCYLSIVLSLFSSCQAITIPETMIVIGLLIKPAAEKTKDWIYERLFEFGAACFLVLVLPLTFLLPQTMLTMPVGNGLGMPLLAPTAYYATQLKALLTYYLRVFFVPVPLSIFPPFCLADSLADPLALGGLAVVLGTVYLLFHYARNKDPYCFLGLWLFLIGLLPQSLVVTNEYVSGPRFYLSCFGLCLFVARLFTRAVASKLNLATDTTGERKLAFEPAFVVPLSLVCLLLIGLSNYRDRGFATDSAVLRGALRSGAIDKNLDRGGHIRALLSLMLILDGGPNIDKGEIEAKRALDINRELPLAYLALARHASYREDFDGAKYYAEKTLELAKKQNLSNGIIGLADGTLLIAMTHLNLYSDPQKLKDMARAALEVEPTNNKLYLALAQVYLSEHKPESGLFAVKYLGHARRLDANDLSNEAPLAEALLVTGNPNNFEAAYKHAMLLHKISPTNGSYRLLARAALETGRIRKGLDVMDELFVRSHGNLDPESLYILSALCRRAGNVNNAQLRADQYLARAKRYDPDIEKKVKLWLRIEPLTPIEEERERAAEGGKPIVEKHPPRVLEEAPQTQDEPAKKP
ncbi:MAG: hypothetical protein JSS83_07345 [Cyanobacteria bacterium SZAS LIN-3]|nr:hypothetical protein [Cyanobacteria bacterium SZAS LIN-3]MBS2010991.1 hypothetical protein [Cyanobacteria bacterium SZAS TMP-1]